MTIIVAFRDGSTETYACQSVETITDNTQEYLQITAPSGHKTRIATWGISECKLKF